MKNFSPAYAAHVRGNVTTITRCWRVKKRNGGLVLGTEHDRDVVITTGPRAGTYLAAQGFRPSDARLTSDMSVTNMEVDTVLRPANVPFAFNAADIRARQFDTAPVEVFELNYQNPDDYQDVIVSGFIGEIRYSTDGRKLTTEIRGLWQKANQTIGKTDGSNCDVKRFGDARCKLNVEALRMTGSVTEAITRTKFRAVFNRPEGSAEGLVRLWNRFSFPLFVGDEFTAIPGCDRTFAACLFYGNSVNFRGHGYWAPGRDGLTAAPDMSGSGSPPPITHRTGSEVKEIIGDVVGAILGGGGIPSLPAGTTTPLAQTMSYGEIAMTTGDNAGEVQMICRVDFE